MGTDQVTTYDLDSEGQLTQIATYHSNPGAGPRHLVFHHHYKIAYLICELNSTIEVLIYDGVGEFEHMQQYQPFQKALMSLTELLLSDYQKMVNTSMRLIVVMILLLCIRFLLMEV